MFFMHRKRPALARMVRNSNARAVERSFAIPAAAPTASTVPVSTLDAIVGRIHDVRSIPPSAMSRLTGSPTVYVR
ncbi:hypothetical protein [Bifidobacterium leontopitheci]|uniref:Uncharacterized protein n=1 Tax=Bifidobacterium leontopitheci TaxID=2650774 RepID=A0A6I1GEQ6_9BIFI|nr:hypothetical protein [Bifidobacterium leontopitheci]KAB7790133.1 hypothetical protein F7D09_1395 [Bifidobacterium leontopitheci]